MPEDENPRVKQLAASQPLGTRRERRSRCPKAKCIGVRDALFEAIFDRFYTDPTLIAYGEENRDWGGAFAVYRGPDRSAAVPSAVQLARSREGGDRRHAPSATLSKAAGRWSS